MQRTSLPLANQGHAMVETQKSKEGGSDTSPGFNIAKMMLSEFIGTMLLVSAVVGSGIQADMLSPDDGVALIGNALATWGALYILIATLGPVSGAHFNPIVSIAFWLKRELSHLQLVAFMVMQFSGGIIGTLLAIAMFEEESGDFVGKDRDSGGEAISEIVSTFGLLLTIFGCISAGRELDIPMAVGIYITAGYFFTSSTAFANPAVTVARTFTDTFASINPDSVPIFIASQFAGLVVSMPLLQWMLNERVTAEEAIRVLWRGEPPLQQTPSA